MKLIIDIPKHIQIACKDAIENTNLDSMELHKDILKQIANGVPLEDIKAEIEEEKLDVDLDIGNETIYNNAINDVLAILDKHIKENQ